MIFRNKFLLAISVLILFFVVSCQKLSDVKPSDEWLSTATINSFESPSAEVNQPWVIITKEHAEEIGYSWLFKGEGYWTPSEGNILKLEKKLAGYLSQNSDQLFRQPPVWEQLEQYQRQYIGIERGGKQIIYGNFFCDNSGLDWQKFIVIVLDGGDCYFQVEYDIEDGAFIMLSVNGES